MRTEKVHESSFAAVDAGGNDYLIHVIREYKIVSTSTRRNQRVAGGDELFTDDGRPVNWLAKGRYQLLDGTELTSDDPDAP